MRPFGELVSSWGENPLHPGGPRGVVSDYLELVVVSSCEVLPVGVLSAG